MKPLPARSLVVALQPKPAPVADAAAVSAVSFDAVLPAVPDDVSWLKALKAGGVLKVEQSTVISALRAALAHRAGLFTIPGKLVDLMERFADENEEQVPPDFFSLRKQLTRRSYAELFQAIDGMDGSYVTEARKTQLFDRIDTYMWPTVIEFYDQLKAWQEAWLQGTTNPGAMLATVMAGMAGGGAGGMALPPGIMQPPDTGVLRDSASAVADAINKVFAGTGVQITAAVGFDANQIKETLANPQLPAMIGVANRDQMLRKLEVAVSATYPRLETNLTRFVLAVMQADDQPGGNEELQYFGTLGMLGAQIPWDQLGGRSGSDGPTGIGRSRRGGKEL
jgi:hypothetical protein